MIKKSKNTFICVLAFICLLAIFLSGVTFSTVKASDDSNSNQVNYKSKVVSVVYDNSYSMYEFGNGESNPPQKKVGSAKYALQMLVSMLGKDDLLFVCPMNNSGGREISADKMDEAIKFGDIFSFNLTTENRTDEINKIKDKAVLNYTMGGTPFASVGNAIELLKHPEKLLGDQTDVDGMKTAQELGNTEQNFEYWLVILSDGVFNEADSNNIVQSTNDMLQQEIDGYAGLNTIYMTFGHLAEDFRDPNLSLNRNYPFSAYLAPEPENLIAEMEKVANKILGKYSAKNDSDKTYYFIDEDEDKVVIDLDKFDFALNSVTVMAQNCGAKIKEDSVTYKKDDKSKDLTTTLHNTLYNFGLPDTDLGDLAVIKGSSYMDGGTIEIVFDGDIEETSSISILVEPALYIEAYLEYFDGSSWQVTDMQFINSNMSPGDTIRVGYDVYSSASKEKIDSKYIFGEHVEKVTYCGQGYAIGEDITLLEGVNEIYVSVEVLNGAYTMKTSLTCYIEKDPTHYRITSQVSTGTGSESKKSQIVYTVFVGGNELPYSEFSKYEWSVIAKDPKGNETAVGQLQDDNGIGKIYVQFDGTGKDYGNYVFEAKVVSKETNISRVVVDKISVLPKDILVECLTLDTFSTTQFLLETTERKIEFGLKLEGNDETFENEVIDYSVTLNGTDIKDKCTIEGNKLVFIVSKDTMASAPNGFQEIKVSVSAMGGVNSQAQYGFSITESAFMVKNVDMGTNEFSRYNVSKANAGLYFQVYKDGKLLTVDQINMEMDAGNVNVELNPSGWITVLPCAVDVTVEEIDGQPIIACKVRSDIFKPLDNLLGSFIFANDKTITVEVGGASADGTFIITEVSMMSRIIRWIIIFIIILIILHLVLFLVGFVVAKPLPKGTLIGIAPKGKKGARVTDLVKVNLKHEILMWHLSRLIPFRELKDQKSITVGKIKVRIDTDKKNRGTVYTFEGRKKTCLKEYVGAGINNANPKGQELYKFTLLCRKGGGSKGADLKLSSNDLPKLFASVGGNKEFVKGDFIGANKWYGSHKVEPNGAIGKVLGYYIFLPKNK